MVTNSLAGKTIAVTGGASGIGLGIVKKLLALNAKVSVADVSPMPDEFKHSSNLDNLVYFRVNVGSREEVHTWIKETVTRYGRLDGICANAGICPVEGGVVSDEMYQRIFSVNVDGVWNCGTEAFWQFQKQGGGGVIVNTASGAGLRAVKGLAAYSAAKHAVIGMTKGWALDWADKGIRVNALSPGLTSSGMQRAAFKEAKTFGANLEAGIPMGRMGQPEELADTVIFLLGDTASFITGSIMVCDGGSNCAPA